MSSVADLIKGADNWRAGGVPTTMMMNMERRHGEDKPVIQKALVLLDAAPFKHFASCRSEWADQEAYLFPGAIQYYGPTAVCDQTNNTLVLERS